MSRLRSKFVWTGIFILCAVLPISGQHRDSVVGGQWQVIGSR